MDLWNDHEAKMKVYAKKMSMDITLKTRILEALPECYVKESKI